MREAGRAFLRPAGAVGDATPPGSAQAEAAQRRVQHALSDQWVR